MAQQPVQGILFVFCVTDTSSNSTQGAAIISSLALLRLSCISPNILLSADSCEFHARLSFITPHFLLPFASSALHHFPFSSPPPLLFTDFLPLLMPSLSFLLSTDSPALFLTQPLLLHFLHKIVSPALQLSIVT